MADDENPAAAVNRVAVKLPEFWANKPRIWFLQADACFRTSDITADRTKYDYVLSKLPCEVLESVADLAETFATDQNAADCYKKLRDRLTGTYDETEWQRLERLVTHAGLGDSRPSVLMNQLLSLLPTGERPGKLFLHHFLRHLPADVRSQLTDADQDDPRRLAEQADRIWASRGGGFAVSAVGRQASPRRRRSPSRPNRGRAQTPAPDGDVCFYHSKYGAKAHRCRAPCSWAENAVAADGK